MKNITRKIAIVAATLGSFVMIPAAFAADSVDVKQPAKFHVGKMMNRHHGKSFEKKHQKRMDGEFKKGMRQENVDRKVENIINGITVTMTSTDAATVTKLQSKEVPVPKGEKVSVTKVNLDNGVKVTITSTDAETVKKLQQPPKMHGRGGVGKDNLESK